MPHPKVRLSGLQKSNIPELDTRNVALLPPEREVHMTTSERQPRPTGANPTPYNPALEQALAVFQAHAERTRENRPAESAVTGLERSPECHSTLENRGSSLVMGDDGRGQECGDPQLELTLLEPLQLSDLQRSAAETDALNRRGRENLTAFYSANHDEARASATSDNFAAPAAVLAAELLAAKGLQFRPQKQRRLSAAYALLLEVALTQKAKLEANAGRALPLTTVGFTCAGVMLAAALSEVCSRQALTTYLNDLEGAGLIMRRGRVVTVEVGGVGRARQDTTVWRVSLSAEVEAKLTPLDFQPGEGEADPGEALERRISEGETAYMLLGKSYNRTGQTDLDSKLLQILKDPTDNRRVELLLNPLPPACKGANPPLQVSVRVSHGALSEELRALETAPKSERRARVNALAERLASALRDGHSLNFYRLTLWQTLRAVDAGVGLEPLGGSLLLSQLADLLSRAVTASSEGAVRCPGRFAVSLVKGWHWWDEIARVPLRRVGKRPQRAAA